ncbi:sensor histidine kinase, partial [Candidatus Neomarinimicrobiota bacterium]
MSLLKEILTKKRGFWSYQLIGWFIFLIVDHRNNLYRLGDFVDYLIWLSSFFTGFLITVVFRYFFKYFYNLKLNLPKISTVIALFSIAGAFLWFYLRGLIYSTVFSFKLGDFENYYNYFTQYGLFTAIWILLVPLLGWSIVYFGIRIWTDLVAEKQRIVEINLQAQEAKLKMFRYQLNPHFFFNSLNSIQALMYHNTKLADKMLTELSEFLRYTLKDNDKVFTPLEKEIEMIEKYFLIEKIRFNE